MKDGRAERDRGGRDGRAAGDGEDVPPAERRGRLRGRVPCKHAGRLHCGGGRKGFSTL